MMQLSELIQHLPFLEKRNFSDVPIRGISFHSAKIQPGDLFIAMVGTVVDGHDFIAEALEKGAVAIVVERPISIPDHVPVFRVQNTRVALSHLAAAWHKNPSQDLQVIGVTGTNGKTTITCLIEAMLQDAGRRSGRIGTIGWHYDDQLKETNHTTPESYDLQAMLAEMKSAGVTHVAMEASSHAIDLARIANLAFDIAVFTNLTPEHLDYHKSMELYFESKKKLFTYYLPRGKGLKRSIVNADDHYGQQLIEILKDSPLWTYSTKAQSKWDIFVKEWSSDLHGMHGIIGTPEGDLEFSSPLIGAYNLSNILAAVAAALSCGVALESIAATVKNFQQVPGRLERVPNDKGLHVFVDYAHTPDALKNVLQAIRHLDPKHIITVFGCGGDRDPRKRPMMGREVARFSDFAIITSDNPRTEDPQKIIEAILPGIQEGGMTLDHDCWIQEDRHLAIQQALVLAKPGDVVLIAGKGHEDYQIIGKRKIHFDDREEVRKFLGAPA